RTSSPSRTASSSSADPGARSAASSSSMTAGFDSMRLQIDVVVRRGAIAESRHRVQAAVSDAQGVLHAGTEQSSLVTTFRSAAKPFRLLPLGERGHAERWGWTDEDLAVMAASHTGSPAHVARVRAILGRLGLTEENLACGFHDPLDPESIRELWLHPERQ